MSQKAVITPFQVITNGDMSGNLTSLVTAVLYSDNVGYEVVWTGTPVGVFAVEVTISGSHWEPLTFDPALTTPSGSAGSFVIDLNQLPYKQIRLSYAATSGSGSLNVWTMSKRLGG